MAGAIVVLRAETLPLVVVINDDGAKHELVVADEVDFLRRVLAA